MEAQQIFDTVVNHLRQQGHKSFCSEEQIETLELVQGSSPICAYRSPEGDKCAAGILITDEEYNVKMEGLGIATLLRYEDRNFVPASLRERLGQHYELIESLQFTHDRTDVEDWEDAWQDIARSYGLTYSKPNAPDSQTSHDTGS
jgi:hypothetical protein